MYMLHEHVHFKYGPGAFDLEKSFQIINGPGPLNINVPEPYNINAPGP